MRWIPLALSCLALLGCFPNWDSLDPSLGSGNGGTGAVGGGTSTGVGGDGGSGGTMTGIGGGGVGGGAGGGEGGMEPLGPWSTPKIVAALSHPADDDDPTITADGLELYFDSRRNGGTEDDIWVTTRSGRTEPWTTPTIVSELNSPLSDGNHTVSPDGLTMWIQSNRDDATSSAIMYVATRTSRAATWSTPIPADDLNASNIRDVAGVTWDGLTMVGDAPMSGVASEMVQLVRASTSQSWGAAVPLAELNSSGSDSEGWLHPDGTHVAFGSNRMGGLGSGDIYVSSRASLSDPFDAPMNVMELNSSSSESDITMTEDRRYVLFARPVGPNGEREIFEASR